MCLAIPAKVIEIIDEETARVSLDGVKKHVSIALIEDLSIGDYVVVHVGCALAKIDPEEARITLALIAEATGA